LFNGNLFIYLFIRLAKLFYVILGAVGELSEKELAATAATIITRILTTLIKEVYANAWKSFSIKVKPDQKKRF
jgi:hypothetical protein